MSSTYNQTVAQRLTRERLSSYLSETGGELREALGLYDWNIRAGAAMHEDIDRFEVVFGTSSRTHSSNTARPVGGKASGISNATCFAASSTNR